MYLAQFENKLRKHLGTKVQIIDKAKGNGRIEIHYYSGEDLSRIVELLEGTG